MLKRQENRNGHRNCTLSDMHMQPLWISSDFFKISFSVQDTVFPVDLTAKVYFDVHSIMDLSFDKCLIEFNRPGIQAGSHFTL